MTEDNDLSIKGLLAMRPDGLGRIPKRAAAIIAKAVDAAINYALDQQKLDRDLSVVIRRIVLAAIEAYPKDRSCHTCDFDTFDGAGGRYCTHWGDKIPSEALEAGCEKHQAASIPF